MPDLPALLAFWAAFALAVVSPGPNFALMLRVGLGSGRTIALRTVLGIAVGEAIWGWLRSLASPLWPCAIPCSARPSASPAGAFLLWLAFGALRSAWRGSGGEEAAAVVSGGGFWTGLALMLLNAKAGFFWVSLTGVLLGTDLPATTVTLAVGVAVMLSLLWHGLLAVAFSGRRLTGLYRRARRGIEGVLGAALAALGIKLLAAS